MNTKFVIEIFSSEGFREEYNRFLQNFDKYLLEDNNKKIQKLIPYILDCIKSNSLSKLGKYSRLPWLEVWNDTTKSMAFDLIPNLKLISRRKAQRQ